MGYYYHMVLCVLGVLFVVVTTGRLDDDTTQMPAICTEEQGCKCSRTAAGYWVQVSCTCIPGQNLMEIRQEQLPTELLELELSGCREVRILGGALSHQTGLRRVYAHNLGTLFIRRHAFLNSTATNALLQAENCSAVVLESNAYRGTSGPHSVLLEKCGHVVIQPSAFSWLQDFKASSITRLELQKHAFSQPGASIGRHGPATTVVIEDALLPEIPSYAFPSSAAELRLDRSEIRAIRRDAFCGLDVLSLAFRNCSLKSVERGALSPRTLIHRLVLTGLRDTNLAQGAIMSAVSNLTLQHSRIVNVAEGAVNITVATVTITDNKIIHVGSRGFLFQHWDHLDVSNNTFGHLSPNGIWTLSERPRGKFVFSDNIIGETDPSGGTLHFGLATTGIPDNMDIKVKNNKFDKQCHCGLQSWLKREVGPKAGEMELNADYSDKWTNFWVDIFHNTSLCVVTNVLARCFGGNNNIEVGYMSISNFMFKVCQDKPVIVCKSAGDGSEEEIIPKPIDTFINPKRNDDTLLFVIILSFVALAILSIIIVLYVGKKWQQNYPNTLHSISSNACKFFQSCYQNRNNNNNNNNIIENNETPTLPIGTAGTVITNSIDHLPGHDYIEVHGNNRRRKRRRKRRPHRRDMGITVNEDNIEMTDVTMGSSSDSETGTDRTGSTFEHDSLLTPSEDKCTQTIPETSDLTMELLQELKEKLNDPNNYSEARDVIEHLYDLIKVEDTNSHSLPSTSTSISHHNNNHNNLQIVREEINSSSEDELYDVIQPSTRTIIPPKIPPLPSTTCIKTPVCEYSQPQDRRNHVYTELPSTSYVTHRAVDFFKSLLPKPRKRIIVDDPENPPQPHTSTSVSEYMEPNDTQVHVYTELPANMANRPLPRQPIEEITTEDETNGDDSS